MTPLPSEGFVLACLKVYDVWWGLGYAITGCLLETAMTFVIARRLGRFLVDRAPMFVRVQWVIGHGAWRILLIRLLLIPGIVVNYALAMSPLHVDSLHVDGRSVHPTVLSGDGARL
ncbi:VTT domain-containing protein [Alicyclobacillus sp. SP_1]|uniref:VTT domain-containing protein n=1 Tax=Alicyclobacillus sp. SP_1 TaxID=2942475 RepID=UPI0021577718|nr:VTT domain-containing protein [Alicyclobacillus sp. SP_1]